MRLNRLSAIALLVVLGVSSMTRAQQPVATMFQLEEEIARLSVVDRDPATPLEIRTLNRSFLDERKRRLRVLLEERVTALQTYRRLVSLTPTESRALDESIRKVEKELLNLQDEDYVGRATDSDSARDLSGTGSSLPARATVLPGSVKPPQRGQKTGGKPDVTTIQVNQPLSRTLPPAIANRHRQMDAVRTRGVIFNRERVPRTLTTGSTATPSQLDADLQTRWVRKFTWGISFPVSQIQKALKK